MKKIIQDIEALKHNTTIQKQIDTRIHEFKTINTHSAEELYTELCFCLLTANFSSQRSIHIHAQLKSHFGIDSSETLAAKLKASGYRFPHTRAAYITEARAHKDSLPTILHTLQGEDRRAWLVHTIKGFGYKEASHFLRNIGYDDYAIIDSHILDLLTREKLIRKPKTLTQKKYKTLEKLLRTLALQTNLTLAELDLYLWYQETGKILK